MKKAGLILLFALVLVPCIAFSSPETLTKALNYVVSMQEENGAWSRLKGEFPAETEPTSWAVKVLAMNRMERERVEKGSAFMLKDQKPDGSWNNNTAHTAFSMLALTQVGQGKDAVHRAVSYLRKVQEREGGFQRIGKEGPSLTVYTAVVLCALKEAGLGGSNPMAKKAIAWLTSCQNKDGGYGMPKGSPSVAVGTAWSIKALLAYGTSPDAPSVKGAIEWLIKDQKPSGGFGMMPPAPEDPEVTAYAIMALAKAPGTREVTAKAAEYLAGAQQADGSFISDSPVQFNKVAKKNTQTTCFVAWALSEIK